MMHQFRKGNYFNGKLQYVIAQPQHYQRNAFDSKYLGLVYNLQARRGHTCIFIRFRFFNVKKPFCLIKTGQLQIICMCWKGRFQNSFWWGSEIGDDWRVKETPQFAISWKIKYFFLILASYIKIE